MSAIVKTVRRYGNSGGVYVPSRWIGGRVKVQLVEEPLDPKRDILNKIPLEHVVSAIVYGSYARKELLEGSDVDILLVVDDDAKVNIPEEIKQKYDIQIKGMKELRNAVAHDPLLYKVIKDEAVALINHQFLDNLKKESPKPTGVETRAELIESSLNITKEIFKANEDVSLIYPLIMRLKEILLLEYFLTHKKYSTKALKQEILKDGISQKEFYLLLNIYRAERNNKKIPKYSVPRDITNKLISILEKRIHYVRQKAREKRN